jgi:hypothetical protein
MNATSVRDRVSHEQLSVQPSSILHNPERGDVSQERIPVTLGGSSLYARQHKDPAWTIPLHYRQGDARCQDHGIGRGLHCVFMTPSQTIMFTTPFVQVCQR